MIGRIDRDEKEAKLSASHKYGKKFRSYRVGFIAGKKDGKKLEEGPSAKNPFPIPSEVLELLKKRARWQMGYDYGYQIGGRIKRKKQAKRKVRRK